MTTQAEEVNRLLASIIGRVRQDLARPETTSPVVAPYVQSPNVQQTPLPGRDQPSVAGRIFEVLARPIYGVMNVAEKAVDESDPLTISDVGPELWEGISGKDKVLGSDVLEAAGMEEGPARTALGFTGDVLLDPLTYVAGAGLFSKIGAGGKKVQKSLGSLGEVEKATESQTRDLISRAVGINPEEVAAAETTAMGRLRSPRPVAEEPIDPLRQATPTSIEVPRVDVSKAPGFQQLRETSARETLERPTVAVGERFRGQPVEEALPAFLQSQRGAAKRQITPEEPRTVLTDPVAEAGARETAKVASGRLATKEMPELEISATGRELSRDIAKRFLNKNQHKVINEAGQEDLLRMIMNNINKRLSNQGVKAVMSPYWEGVRYSAAFNHLRVAEEVIEAAGRKFKSKGKEVRPSEVMNEVGTRNVIKNKHWRDAFAAFATGNMKNITHEPLKTELGKVLSNRATVQADISNLSLEEAVRRGSELSQNAVAAQAKQNKETLAEALGHLQKQAGLAATDVKTSKEFLKKILDPPKDLPMTAVQSQAVALMRQAVTGKFDLDAAHALGRAVYESLGANPKVLASVIGDGNKAFAGIMSRVATWFGAKDLRPFQREALDSARIAAAAFTQAWRPVVRNVPLEGRQAAWRAAQGGLTPTSEVEARVAQQFTDAMEKLLHSPRLSDEAAKGNTVALRAGISMDELNDALKATGSKNEFTNEIVKDKYGNVHDFSNGADWLKSWTVMETDDAVELTYRMHLALQRITRQNAFVDDIGERYGMVKKAGDFDSQINHARLEGLWFPKEIAEQANNLIKAAFDPANYKSNIPLMRLYDKSLGAFKSGVTIYNPSHHIRNAIGDIWLAALDGVTSPRPYMDAIRVIHSQKGRYRDLMNVLDITDPEALARAMTRPGDTILTTRGGHKLTAEQIYTAAFNKGILLRATELEDIIEAGGRLVPDLPITQGRVRQAAHSVSELRDHYIRLGHFIHVLRNSKQKDLTTLFSEASHRVKRYHPDGMDMTEFERKVMKRLIPFYSWMRKSTPLVVEAMVQRPSLVTLFPKAQYELQDMFGIEPAAGLSDPFPTDQLFPDWIRAKGVGPLLTPENPLTQLARNEPPGYAMLKPDVPFNDAAADFSDPVRTLRSALTPHISIPASLYAGKDPLGIPLEHSKVGPVSGAPAYAAQQILPPLGTGARVTGQTRPEESFSSEQLIRWLTASGLIGTGPYKEQAAFEERERRTQ